MDPYQTPEEALLAAELSAGLYQALQGLSPRQITVLTCRYGLEGVKLSQHETAQVLRAQHRALFPVAEWSRIGICKARRISDIEKRALLALSRNRQLRRLWKK